MDDKTRIAELEAEIASLERENDHKHGLFMEACDQRDEARAALVAVLQWHDTGQHPDATPWADVRAALKDGGT